MFDLTVICQEKLYADDVIVIDDDENVVDDDDNTDWMPNSSSKRLNPFQRQLDSQIKRPFYGPLRSIKKYPPPPPTRPIHLPQQPCKVNQPVKPTASEMFFNYVSSTVNSMPPRYALGAQKEINDVLVKYQLAVANLPTENGLRLIDLETEELTNSGS